MTLLSPPFALGAAGQTLSGKLLRLSLGANWRHLAARAAPAECGAAVKADAYGIGIEAAVPALARAGCLTFFVAHASEGRRASPNGPQCMQNKEQVMSNFIVSKVAVLGAGVMGAQIAAHLVNAGVPAILFDLPAKEGTKNGIALKAIEGLKKLPSGGYEVGHSAQVIGFDHNSGVVIWTPGSPVGALKHDFALLVERSR